jgi:hypothetical protein
MGLHIELHSSLTWELYGGEWSGSHPSHFSPGEKIPLPIEQEAGSVPELVWKNLLPSPEIKLSTIQPTCYIIT